jgi:protein-disulfide isomerase
MSNETKILTIIGIVTAVVIIGAAFTLGGKPTQTTAQQNKVLGDSQAKILVRPDSHVTGPSNAKVTVVEFGDFQCPACGAAYPVVKQIEAEYKNKIKFVFRNFPLQAHPNAPEAAEAAEAAGTQGKFWQMYDKLYSSQNDWSGLSDPTDTFVGYAKDLGLNTDQFKQEVQSKKYANKITQDQNDGNSVGLQATPTFFINKEMVIGVIPYDEFKTKLDAALKTK